jgi:NAD+ synthetase
MGDPTRMECPRDDEFGLWLELLEVKASEELLNALGDFLQNYLRSSGLKMYVMGLSGGIDSSFLAALLHSRRIPYLGFCMPIASNTPEETERGTRVAEAYAMLPEGVAIGHVQDFTDLYRAISATFSGIRPDTTPVAEGNLKARTRMLFLYHMAQLHGGCVLSTDQLDELLTGFWTLHGDVGDVSPIQLIPKSTEYDLARMLCSRLDDPAPLQAAIDAVPTDGLGISRSDLDQLEAESYAQVEEMFREYFQLRRAEQRGGLTPAQAGRRAELEGTGPVRRFLASGFKRAGAVLLDPRGAGR